MAATPSAASIPNITALRKALDYGEPHLPRCAAFYDDIRVFRKKFRTINGTPGMELYDWKSRDHQAGLNEMTIAYLDKEGNGDVFWPAGNESPNRNKYSYTANRSQ